MPLTSFTLQITVWPLVAIPTDPGGPQTWPGRTPLGTDTAFEVVTAGTVVAGEVAVGEGAAGGAVAATVMAVVGVVARV